MNFTTLQDTSIATIADVFHRAFQGYFVTLEMTEEKLEQKIKVEGIDLGLSAGVFDGAELVGFILHANDTINGALTAYNAGTGVLPSHRGKQLTRKMYEYITPLLKDAGVTNVLLEVIQQNTGATRSYEQSGFRIVRELPCYKGTIKSEKGKYTVEEVGYEEALELQEHFDWQPTWQNAVNTIKNAGNTVTKGIRKNGKPVAAITYTPATMRVHQFVVHRALRRKGMGAALFDSIANTGAVVVAANIDGMDAPTNNFLKAIGLQQFIAQYEMQLLL